MSVRKKGGGRSGGPLHPIQEGIEKLYAAGKTPRIRLDARRNDVVVPDHVRERWQESLVIDLDAGYPLNLAYDEVGVHCDLAFAGHQCRCSFSWGSIYGLFDRASGQGVQIAAHMPKAVLPEALSLPPTALPRLRSVSSTNKPLATKPTTSATPREASSGASGEASSSSASTDASTKASEPTADELAKARRAKFRVINGG